ncbi:MAG TPA: hypothetical protein VGQ81_08465 [Acidobacteriota bacterium]|nr:hypothetical protein [Acidobacteriota bacterium]
MLSEHQSARDARPRAGLVRLVRRGEKNPVQPSDIFPLVIEVKIPGWPGYDNIEAAKALPADLAAICDIFDKANVKFCSPTKPYREGVMVFTADGATEFAFRNAEDFSNAVNTLVRAGWLSPVLAGKWAVAGGGR